MTDFSRRWPVRCFLWLTQWLAPKCSICHHKIIGEPAQLEPRVLCVDCEGWAGTMG